MSEESRIRKCVNCNNEWEFTEREEQYLKERFSDTFSEPRRCRDCRRKRRETKEPEES